MNIKETVKSFIEKRFLAGIQNFDFQDDTLLLESRIIDSSGILELIMHIEETFCIECNDEELVPENFNSLNAIDNFVKSKLACKA